MTEKMIELYPTEVQGCYDNKALVFTATPFGDSRALIEFKISVSLKEWDEVSRAVKEALVCLNLGSESPN